MSLYSFSPLFLSLWSFQARLHQPMQARRKDVLRCLLESVLSLVAELLDGETKVTDYILTDQDSVWV